MVALRKPSEYFTKKEPVVSINENIQKMVKQPELNTFSDAFESFKNNLSKIEVLSEFTETLDNYRINIERVNHLSSNIEDIKNEIQNLLKKEDLDRAMMAQLIVVEKSIQEVQNKVKGINETTLFEIQENVYNLTDSVNEFLEVEVPKYKKLIVESELKTDKKFIKLEENVNETLDGIGEFVENKYQKLTKTLEGINEKSLSVILEDFKLLESNLKKIKEEDIPKYKGFIVETERKTDFKLTEFDEKLNASIIEVLEKINSIENNKDELIFEVTEKINEVKNLSHQVSKELENNKTYKEEIKEKVTNLEVDILRNENHLKKQNKNLQSIQEEVKETLSKINLEEIEKRNYELGKKVKYLEEVFEKFNEKEILTENIVVEPPSTKNEDPLTPLDQNFVTLDQLQQHYRLFLNRIQQQLATFGGGGETRLKYLDDVVGIATNASAYDGKYLKYNHSIQKFEFDIVDTENITANSISIRDTDSNNGYSGDVVSLQKAHTDITQTTSPTSIHKVIPVETYATVEFFIQAIKDLSNIDSRKILTVNNITNINKIETHNVSIGSSFVDYDVNIEDGYVNLIAIPTTALKITYNIVYTAITRPTILNNITTEDDNFILTENDSRITTEDY